jgi:hypothetical protein
MCVVKDCTSIDLAGSHVMKVESTDKEIYIIPLCQEHHDNKEEMDIFDDVPMISANVKKTCLTNASEVVKKGER